MSGMRVGVCVRLALGTCICLAVACGGGGTSGDDESVDAGPPDAYQGPCPVPPGFSHVVTRLRYQPADVGADLDGDGDIDNIVGTLPSSVLDSLHDGLDEAIEVGEWMTIFHVTDTPLPPEPNDDSLVIHAFTGLDSDVPTDASNNYDGEGRFYIRVDEFDLNCESTVGSDEASMTDHVLTAKKDVWSWPLAGGSGTLSMVNGTVVVTYSSDFFTFEAMYTGMTTMCSMAQLPFPGETEGSVLDAFANDLKDLISPDMDLDGDGFESVVGDGTSVLQCIDGDGTIIEGRDCACDARIADAYSLAFTIQGIKATVIGVK